MGVWENLPLPLLGLILDRLPVTDYLRFPGVCPSWRDAQHDHRLLHAASPRHLFQMPWLMMLDESQKDSYTGFYNISEQRYYQLFLPKFVGKYVHGVSHGWLLLVDNIDHMRETIRTPALSLLNPFTGSKIVIPRLPQVFYSKFLSGILSSFPTDPDCVLLLVEDVRIYVYLYHLKNKSRIKLRHPKKNGYFRGIPTFCKGKFYCLSNLITADLVMVDLLPVPAASFIEMVFDHPLTKDRSSNYLLECDGDILLVRRTSEQPTGLKFQVFRGDLALKVWVRLDSLQDHVLFWHYFSIPFFLSATQTRGHGNCIYFTSTSVEKLCRQEAEKESEGWIEYDYGSHEVVGRKLSHSRKYSGRHTLFWIVPSLL